MADEGPLTRVFWPLDSLTRYKKQSKQRPAAIYGVRCGPCDFVVTELVLGEIKACNDTLLGWLNNDTQDTGILTAKLDASTPIPILSPGKQYGSTAVGHSMIFIGFRSPVICKLQYFATESALAMESQLQHDSPQAALQAQLMEKIQLHASRSPKDLLEGSRVFDQVLTVINGLSSRKGPVQDWHGAFSRTKVAMLVMLPVRVCFEYVLRLLQCEILGVSFVKLSATCQQIDVRMQQLCHWPVQYMKMFEYKSSFAHRPSEFALQYIEFYNSIWLVINDVLIGMTMGRIILDNTDLIVKLICALIDGVLTEGFHNSMLWLMDWPAGLKLNTELAAFFGEMFLWVLEFWRLFINSNVRPFLPVLVRAVGLLSYLGATVSLCLLSDFTMLLTLHVHSFYAASSRIHSWLLSILQSLFHLFRGKRFNALRHRIDSCDYELDQLLMGTILFISLSFLLPTTLVFYLTFASSRLILLLICLLLEVVCVCLNHFPLFHILLRLKDPKRVPGGLFFEVHEIRNQVHFEMKSVPLTLTSSFQQLKNLVAYIEPVQSSARILKSLLVGRLVELRHAHFYTLLYQTLPESRESTSQVFQRLKHSFSKR